MNDKNFRSYKRDIVKINNKKVTSAILDFEDAENEIVEYLTEKKMIEITENAGEQEEVAKTKEYLRFRKREARRHVTDCIYQRNISVRGYEGDKIDDFIHEMVNEYAGYSILDDAFEDPKIDDIFCIDWETIFVEKDGENIPYWRKFRNKKHYELIVQRFTGENGKEINVGDSKIVDFELYGDRGCATSPAVSPRDYTLTLRKHKEDHIILEQLIEWNVMTEEMAEFLGMLVDGEMNFIYAGLTGSGKTTTVRALIDHYVTKNQKRMLVCEDTQELFPKNEHTVEFLSYKSNDPNLAVPLNDLILTALRLKPKYIVVGEVRGLEAQAAVEAMETGHSTIFTMHGGTPVNIVNRLVTKYLMAMPNLGIDVVERIIGASVDYIAVQDHIPDIGRVISGIFEISYDFDTRRTKIDTVFEYDFYKNDYVMKKRISPEKAHKLMRRGIKTDYLEKWLNTGDPEKEKEFLENFHKEYESKKEERKKLYKERSRKREDQKLLEESMKKKDKGHGEVNKAILNEELKARELEEMIRKTELLKKQIEEDKENLDKSDE